MIKGSSNIKAVIERAEKLRRVIPEAWAEVVQPEQWRTPAKEVAEKVLNSLATFDEAGQVKAFVATVLATFEEGGMVLQMRRPKAPEPVTLKDAQGAREATTPMERAGPAEGLVAEWVKDYQVMMDLIAEWVATPEEEGGKRRDARDWGKTDQEVADLISHIMLTPRPTDVEMDARSRLMPHILAFINKKLAGSGSKGLTPARAEEWLKAVLAAWRVMIQTRMPGEAGLLIREKMGVGKAKSKGRRGRKA